MPSSRQHLELNAAVAVGARDVRFRVAATSLFAVGPFTLGRTSFGGRHWNYLGYQVKVREARDQRGVGETRPSRSIPRELPTFPELGAVLPNPNAEVSRAFGCSASDPA